MRVKAVGACSGGLDGLLASAILMQQGIDVEIVTFTSPFFPNDSSDIMNQLDVKQHKLDFSDDILKILRNPESGFGKNCNPCIDCHAMMFHRLGEFAEKIGADFIFSGEVTGQRPMSQNRGALNRVARLSGYAEILLRPLSAKILPETLPEKTGLVMREKLLDISGRGRKRQMKLASELGLKYQTPAGGCFLTDSGYCVRLEVLLEIPGLLTVNNCRIIRYGRIFRLSSSAAGVIGRNRNENEKLENLAQQSDRIIELINRPGPSAILMGDIAELPLLSSLVAFYGKVRSGENVKIKSASGDIMIVTPASSDLTGKLIVK